MKKLVLLPFLFAASHSYAEELHHYEDIKVAVISGKPIRIAVDFMQCTSPTKSVAQNAYNIGVFSPNEIIVNSKGHIASSLTHFTLNNPKFPSKPVFEFVRYTISSDDNVNVSVQVLDATNYTPLGSSMSFDCKINTAAMVYG